MNRRLSTKVFILTQILILVTGLGFLYGLYYVLNQDQNHSDSYSSTGGPVTSQPNTLTLELQQPDNDLLTFQPSTIVSGTTSPNSEILISAENNLAVTSSKNLVVKSNSNGNFSTLFNLGEGPNLITIVVFDSTGDQRSVTRSVFYSKEKI